MTPTLQDAQAKRNQSDRAYARAKAMIAAGQSKRAAHVVLEAQELEMEADRLELAARRAIMADKSRLMDTGRTPEAGN